MKMNKAAIKRFCIHNRWLSKIYYHLMCNNYSCKGKDNQFQYTGAFLKKCNIQICGERNIIHIEGNFARLSYCKIKIIGSDNRIKIGKEVSIVGCTFHIEDNHNLMKIGDKTDLSGNIELAAIEGTTIEIGKNCLFSANITFRTGDSHSILDASTRKRINPSCSINIGDHVWIGNTVTVLKGANIRENSIVSTGTIVTGKTFPPNSIIGGIPGRILKEGVDWDVQRQVFENEDS